MPSPKSDRPLYAPKFEFVGGVNSIAVMHRRRVKDDDSIFKSDDDDDNSTDGKSKGVKGHTHPRSNARRKLFIAILLAINLVALKTVYSVLTKKRPNGSPSEAASSSNNITVSASAEGAKSSAVEVETVEAAPEPATKVTTKVENAKPAASITTEDWSQYCPKHPPTAQAKKTIEKRIEPLWLPNYPSALPSLQFAEFADTLTGVPKAAKNYYRQSPSLKRCHYKHSNFKIDGVTCEIVHPIVPCLRPTPTQQKDSFSDKLFVSIRNPLSGFFSVYQSKAEAYHGAKGQVAKKDWINFRDQYVGNETQSHMYNQWEELILVWRNMVPYHVAEYLPYEYWLDTAKGPAMTTRISRALKEEGFPILFEDKGEPINKGMACLWYQHFYVPLMAEEKKQQDDQWYVPEYTKGQLKGMLSRLEKLNDNIKKKQTTDTEKRPGDVHLITILTDYASAVRDRLSSLG